MIGISVVMVLMTGLQRVLRYLCSILATVYLMRAFSTLMVSLYSQMASLCSSPRRVDYTDSIIFNSPMHTMTCLNVLKIILTISMITMHLKLLVGANKE